LGSVAGVGGVISKKKNKTPFVFPTDVSFEQATLFRLVRITALSIVPMAYM
jgi:hypothetical protein